MSASARARGVELANRIKDKIADVIIPVSVIDETGLYQAVKEASRVLKETEIYAERQAWDGFMSDLMKGSSTASYGKAEVLEALHQGRVDILMVVEDETDLIDNLYDEIENYGTELMIFSSQTESGAQLKNFGGIAARLRY